MPPRPGEELFAVPVRLAHCELEHGAHRARVWAGAPGGTACCAGQPGRAQNPRAGQPGRPREPGEASRTGVFQKGQAWELTT